MKIKPYSIIGCIVLFLISLFIAHHLIEYNESLPVAQNIDYGDTYCHASDNEISFEPFSWYQPKGHKYITLSVSNDSDASITASIEYRKFFGFVPVHETYNIPANTVMDINIKTTPNCTHIIQFIHANNINDIQFNGTYSITTSIP